MNGFFPSYLADVAIFPPTRASKFPQNYEGDVEELGLFFAVDEDLNGEKTTFPLIPGGAEIPVTREKFVEYKNRVSDYWLSRRIRDHSDAFMKGLSMVMELEWLRMFSPGELQMIISGSVKPIDVDDLASHTVSKIEFPRTDAFRALFFFFTFPCLLNPPLCPQIFLGISLGVFPSGPALSSNFPLEITVLAPIQR
jgi:hypothetical protein